MQSEFILNPADKNDQQCNQQAHGEKYSRINQLLAQGTLWRASATLTSAGAHTQLNNSRQFISTGFPSVDALLYYRGWPLGQLIECLQPVYAQTVLTPFLPAIQKNVAGSKKNSEATPADIILINPPHIPYLYGWQKKSPLNIYVLSSKELKNTLWACEQVLRSGGSKNIFIWLPEKNIPFSQLRKLQLAANHSKQIFVAFRPQALAQQHSPAALRIKVTPVQHKQKTALQLDILKQPGCWGGQTTAIHWHGSLQNPFLPAKYWPVYQTKNQLSQSKANIDNQLINISSETEKTGIFSKQSHTEKKWS